MEIVLMRVLVSSKIKPLATSRRTNREKYDVSFAKVSPYGIEWLVNCNYSTTL